MTVLPDGVTVADELPHPGGGAEEWIFAAWAPDARSAVISGHRLLPVVAGARRRAWYWAAYALADGPLFHVTEFDIDVRADPFIVKAEALWAEHTCDAPWEQWTIGNETYAAALDDVEEGLGRAYGLPTPIAFDLEWYATGPPAPVRDDAGSLHSYEQPGVVHGVVEIAGRPTDEFVEAPAHRWRRWVDRESPAAAPVEPTSGESAMVGLGPIALPTGRAHTGVRVPFVLPDGTVFDWVLTTRGWCSRRR